MALAKHLVVPGHWHLLVPSQRLGLCLSQSLPLRGLLKQTNCYCSRAFWFLDYLHEYYSLFAFTLPLEIGGGSAFFYGVARVPVGSIVPSQS